MEKSKKINVDVVLTVVALALAFVSVVTILSFVFFGESIVPVIKEYEDDPGTLPDDKTENVRRDGYYTFLIAGMDATSSNTDVLMIASLDTSNGKMKILQIPRDTFVSKDVLGYSNVTRVNAIFAAEYNMGRNSGLSNSRAQKAALEKLKNTIAAAFATEIDDYVLVSISAFRSIVDAVGGVWFDVPYDMDYEDPYQDLYIHLKAGYQLLDGDHAEQLIRFREPTTADIGRTGVRADFMKAMVKQVKENMNVSTVVTIVGEMIGKTVTSLDIVDAIRYARAVYSMPLDSVDIKTVTGSSVWDSATGRWSAHYYLNRAAAMRDVNEYINVFKDEITIEKFDASGLFCDKGSASAEAYYKREDIQ